MTPLLLIIKLAITAWLVSVTLWDWRTGRVPNKLSLPVMLGVGACRLAQTAWLLISTKVKLPAISVPSWWQPLRVFWGPPNSLYFIWVAWVVVFIFWSLRVMGGGDAKIAMGLLAIFPTLHFALIFSCLVVLFGLPAAIFFLFKRDIRRLPATLYQRFLTRRLTPTATELEQHGKPTAWLFCLPGVVYTWFFG